MDCRNSSAERTALSLARRIRTAFPGMGCEQISTRHQLGCGSIRRHDSPIEDDSTITGDLAKQIHDHLGDSHGFEAAAIELPAGGLCWRCA